MTYCADNCANTMCESNSVNAPIGVDVWWSHCKDYCKEYLEPTEVDTKN